MVVRVSRAQYAGLEGAAAAREHLLVSAWARRVLVRAAAAQGWRAVATGEVESVDGALVVSTSAGRGSRRGRAAA
jgi:hypothetical protein